MAEDDRQDRSTEWALLFPLKAGLFSMKASSTRSIAKKTSLKASRLTMRRGSSMSELDKLTSPALPDLVRSTTSNNRLSASTSKGYDSLPHSPHLSRSVITTTSSVRGSIGDLMNQKKYGSSSWSIRSETLVARTVPLSTVTPTKVSPISPRFSPTEEWDGRSLTTAQRTQRLSRLIKQQRSTVESATIAYRFNDWKNTTRSKYRKIMQSRMATGGGPENKTKMTDIEERGLAVWGKVVVTGLLLVPMTGGMSNNNMSAEVLTETEPTSVASTCSPSAAIIEIQDTSAPNVDVHENSNKNVEISYVNQLQESVHEANKTHENDNNKNLEFLYVDQMQESEHEAYKIHFLDNITLPQQVKTAPILRENIEKGKKKTRDKRSMNEIGSALLTSQQNVQNININLVKVIENFTKHYTEIENKRLDAENRKIDFEIAKYKFENKDFHFE